MLVELSRSKKFRYDSFVDLRYVVIVCWKKSRNWKV